MPNWCENNLTICGEEKDIKRFIAECCEDGEFEKGLDFNRIIPEPETPEQCEPEFVLEVDEDELHRDREIWEHEKPWFDWYQWRCAYWGTKWTSETIYADYENESTDTDGNKTLTIYFQFNTAWSPSLPITETLMARYPELQFYHYYLEPGMGYAGAYDAYGESDYNYGDEEYDNIAMDIFGYEYEWLHPTDEDEDDNEDEDGYDIGNGAQVYFNCDDTNDKK